MTADQKQALTQSHSLSQSREQHPQIWTSNERISVAQALSKVFDVQKQFGKTPAQLKTIIEAFCWALQRYPS